jgi:hypothetical protein
MADFKSKFTGAEIDALLDKVNNGEVDGGSIQIVDDISKLPQDASVGSVAVVAVQGSAKEMSFRDMYQPTMDMIDLATGKLINPERLNSISSLKITAPSSFELEESIIILFVPRTWSVVNNTMITLSLQDGNGITAVRMSNNYEEQVFVLVDYSSGSPVINNDSINQFNDILATDDWCYFGNPESPTGITEKQFNTLDMYVKAVAGVPSIAEIYIKKDNWEKLYKRDFEELQKNIDKVFDKTDSKAEPIVIKSVPYSKVLSPNTYYTATIGNATTVTYTLEASTDATKYSEYIIELKCTGTPSSIAFNNADGTTASIVWANGAAPAFEAGITYLISIASGFGVYSMFPNS